MAACVQVRIPTLTCQFTQLLPVQCDSLQFRADEQTFSTAFWARYQLMCTAIKCKKFILACTVPGPAGTRADVWFQAYSHLQPLGSASCFK